MPDVKVTIDGETVSVPAGTNIVDAARAAGVAIPVFCYHPKLKPVGMCRMCLVEVWTPKIDPATRQPVVGADGKPELALMMNKLQPGCVTPVSDGMEVRTGTSKVQFAQKGQLEFLLTSHPLDCPVCDKGGECPLQNLTMQFGPSTSRFDYSDKVHFEKPIPLGDLIYLDRERCILCSRCVRFQDDVAGDPVLGFDNRGRAWEIISKSEPAFDSKFSGNTTDICPVGALTSSDFRFKARVWELKSTPSICPHCPVGCDISVDTRHNELKRVMPRENDFVNEIWICDKGRYGMRFIQSGDRLTQPLVRRGGQLQPATWDEAYRVIGEKLAQVRSSAGAQAIGGIAGTELSNEDMYLFQKLIRRTLGSNNLDHRAGTADEPALDTLSGQIGVGKGTNLLALGKGASVLVVGADPEEEGMLYVPRLRGLMARGGSVTVINPYPTKLGKQASLSVTPRPHAQTQLVLALLKVVAEEKLVSGEAAARVRGLPELLQQLGGLNLADLAVAAGVTVETVQGIARAFAAAESGIIMYGRVALATPGLPEALASLALLTGKFGKAGSGLIALVPGGNARGALDMGVRPEAKGLGAREMWAAAADGRLKALVVAGINPARQSAAARRGLEALEFLVVADLFLTETAQAADVVLPIAAFAEREGTFTNAERRVQRFRQALENSLPAPWEVFQNIARALPESVVAHAEPAPAKTAVGGKGGVAAAAPATVTGAGWDYVVASDVADEIAARVRGYAGTTYTSLGLTKAASWGRQPNEAVYYDGTSYENAEGVGIQVPAEAEDQRGSLTATLRAPLAAPVSEQFPLALIVAPRAYDNGDWGIGSKIGPRMVPAHAILSRADAEALGVAMGERVRIASELGAIELPATVDAGLVAGTVVMPLVRGAEVGDLVTGAVTSVAISKVS